MNVRLLLFAQGREIVGQGELMLTLPEDASIDVLWGHIVEQHPALGSLGDSTAFAVNQSYAPRTTLLKHGDEVALIPPVAGG